MPDREDRTGAFENVRNQIGSCGIWCGSCAVGNGVLRELTQRYHRLIEAYGLKSWAPAGLDYDEFVQGLYAIGAEAVCGGCRQGGGRDACPLRACAAGRRTDHCAECIDSPACAHAEDLRGMRTGARSAGLFIRPTHADRQRLLNQWTRGLRWSWPSSILFDEGSGSNRQ